MNAPPSHPKRRRNALPPIGTRYQDSIDGTEWTVSRPDRASQMVVLRQGNAFRTVTASALASTYLEMGS